MTQAGTKPAAPPADPIRVALDDRAVLADLRRHAAARLGLLLGDRPAAVRADEADEAVQEVSRRAMARAAAFDPAQSAAAWLHGILEHVLHERCRALRKQPAQPAADPAAWDGLAARVADDDPAVLAPLLAALPADQREIVTLRFLNTMSHEQIAAYLNISVPNSRARLSRALGAARTLAAKEGGR